MSLLYLIRHGQAGPRDHYDDLSPLGRRQAALLGAWLAREGLRFDAVWTGGLSRQQLTARLALEASAAGGQAQPEPVADPRWNEFDLDAVYAAIAPQLARDDDGFRLHYESLLSDLAAGKGEVHRHWTHSDTLVVQAWIHGRYPFQGESWDAFNERVHAAGEAPLTAAAGGRRVAVFTSATPVGITLSRAIPLQPGHIMRLAGSAINSNMTVLRFVGGEPALLTFNSVPHLDPPELRTFR